MARIRSIKPTFWSDEKVGLLPRDVRMTFLGLISALADDHGRLVGNARIVRGAVYPYDDDVTVADIEAHLVTLAGAGRIMRYQVAGSDYIAIANWSRHQRVDKPSPSLLPAPPASFVERSTNGTGSDSANDPGTLPTDRKGEGREEEREGEKDRRRSGAEGLPAGSATSPTGGSPEGAAELPASLLEMLPPEALQLLAQFYEFPAMTAAQVERYRAVAMQLVDAVDPRHAGPKIRGGVRVKARSAEHMAECCRAVIANPPMDRDLAVLWVLKKLTDPPKGPSPTDALSRAEGAARQLEETYAAEARTEALQWARNHPERYQPILTEVEATYRGRSGKIVDMAKASELAQRCAKAAGFPSFDEWRRGREGANG